MDMSKILVQLANNYAFRVLGVNRLFIGLKLYKTALYGISLIF